MLDLRPFTNRQQFLIASRGPEIAAHLIAEQNADFTATFGSPTAEALERFQEKQATGADLVTICAAFFAKTYPVKKPTERKIDVMDWIIDRTLNDTHNGKPILCEDLYKIGEQVNYFTGLKHSGALPPQDHLTAYPSLQALDERLAPFEEKRRQKEQARLERHMPDEQRARIMAESSILYQGPSGTVVVPHTPLASQYWGNGTKWCISGRSADDHFPGYNSKNPITIFMPHEAEKMAYTGGSYWDPRDEKHDKPSEAVAALRTEFSNHNADTLKSWKKNSKKNWLKGLFDFSTIRLILRPKFNNPYSLNERERHWFKKLTDPSPASHMDIPPDLTTSKRFMKIATYWWTPALRYAALSLRSDPKFILELMKEKSLALRYAAPSLKTDPAFVLSAIQKNLATIKDIDPVLESNSAFALYVLEHARPETILKITNASLNMEKISDQEILAAQMDALQTLLDEEKGGIAADHLRFIKPLWGKAERIFGDPAEQLAYLRTLPAGRPAVLPAPADPVV